MINQHGAGGYVMANAVPLLPPGLRAGGMQAGQTPARP